MSNPHPALLPVARQHLLVGGRWTAPASPTTVDVRSPHDGSVVGKAPVAVQADVDAAVAAAQAALHDGPWPRMPPLERAAVVARLLDDYAALARAFADLVTAQMGMPIAESVWRQRDAVERARHFVEVARTGFDWETIEPGPQDRSIVRRDPVGVVAAIVPWNGPQMIAMGKLVPALLAGCPVILKPALETALDAQLLAQVVAAAELPPGLVSILPADQVVSEYLVSHAGVDMISFTGATATGRHIAQIAGQRLARVQLELGGKSAEIVMADADLEGFAQNMRRSSYANTGQICTSHTRILAAQERYADIVDIIAATVGRLRIGNPALEDTEIGPLANARQYDTVSRYIALGLEEGARAAVGGPGRPEAPGTARGYYVKPTVFVDAHNGMRIAREEIFGPVLTVIPFRDEDDAVRIANDSPFGLSGGVWTADPERGLALGRRVRTGRFKVNGARPNFNAPFGGFKCSGIGREYGAIGLGEYTEYKVLAI